MGWADICKMKYFYGLLSPDQAKGGNYHSAWFPKKELLVLFSQINYFSNIGEEPSPKKNLTVKKKNMITSMLRD